MKSSNSAHVMSFTYNKKWEQSSKVSNFVQNPHNTTPPPIQKRGATDVCYQQPMRPTRIKACKKVERFPSSSSNYNTATRFFHLYASRLKPFLLALVSINKI